MKKVLALGLVVLLLFMSGCGSEGEIQQQQENKKTIDIGAKLSSNQPTPTDIEYSLERHMLIKRTYWVNGQREKAMNVRSPIEIPIGYALLLTAQGQVVGEFMVEGKVVSLNSYLTPDSEFYEASAGSGILYNNWLPDVDGAFGENDRGIFFFTPDGKYVEWNGTYLYSDIPFNIKDTIIGGN